MYRKLKRGDIKLADNKNKMKFEEAMAALEKIVESMQDGKMPLDESIKKFEEGVGLIHICQSRLENAEGKIKMLVKDSDGKVDELPFETGSEE